MKQKTSKFVIVLKVVAALILTGALIAGAGFGFLMVACSGGGALVVVIPIALVALPVYYRSMKYLFGKRKNKEGEGSSTQPTMNKDQKALVQYIHAARTQGLSDSTISSNLLNAGGWAQDDINEVFSFVEKETPN